VAARLLGTDDLTSRGASRPPRQGSSSDPVSRRGGVARRSACDAATAFGHALYQNVLYGDLVSKRRTRFAPPGGRAIGGALRRFRHRVSPHNLPCIFERGRDFPRAIEYFTQAGDNAIKLYANAEAERHYSHALSLVEKLSREEKPKRYLNLSRNAAGPTWHSHAFSHRWMILRACSIWRAPRARAVPECAALNALANTFFYSIVLGRWEPALRKLCASRNGQEMSARESKQWYCSR